MTVSSAINTQTFACNGATTAFVCSFRALESTAVLVYLITVATGARTLLANGVDYTVSGVGGTTFTVTTTLTYSSAYQLRVLRRTARLQEVDYRDNDQFPAETHETALDRLTMIVQEDEEQLGRTLRVPLGESVDELPAASERAGKLQGYDSDGNTVVVAPVSGSAAELALDLVSTDAASKGAGQVGYSPSLAYGATTVGAQLLDMLSVKAFGALGDGNIASAAANDVAFAAAIAALSIGTQYGAPRRKRLRIPAGVYYLSANLLFTETSYNGGWTIEGDGDKNTILLFTTTSGDAVTVVGNYFQFRDLAIFGTAARRAGTGRGLYVNASLSTTSYRGEFKNVHVSGHGGNGVEAVRVEHHAFDNVLVQDVGGKGILLDGGAGSASWNVLRNCRAQDVGGNGIELSSSTQHNTLIHPEALNFGDTDTAAIGILCNGRGNVLINPDAENVSNITGATTYTGIRLVGSRHVVEAGYVGDVNQPIRLVSASRCRIYQPTITNATSGVAGADAIAADVSSVSNEYHLPDTVTSFTNVLTPSEGRDRDLINTGYKFGRASTWTPGIAFGGASVGMTFSARVGTYRLIGDLVYVDFDITLSAKGSSTGAVTITGLPFTAVAGNRGMASIAISANGSGLTNLDTSGVSPGGTVITVRTQDAAGLLEMSEANFTDTTRIFGSVVYIKG
jgi:hypothetical protein